MKARRERKFVLLCLAALVALPLAQWWVDLAAGQAPTGTVLLRRFPTVAHLRVADTDLAALLPDNPKRAYDVHPVVDALLDEGTALELHLSCGVDGAADHGQPVGAGISDRSSQQSQE